MQGNVRWSNTKISTVSFSRRYYKVNEVQKFTFKRKKDELKNDVTVSFESPIFANSYFTFVLF